MEGISHNINANGYKITADTEDVDDLYNCGKKRIDCNSVLFA